MIHAEPQIKAAIFQIHNMHPMFIICIKKIKDIFGHKSWLGVSKIFDTQPPLSFSKSSTALSHGVEATTIPTFSPKEIPSKFRNPRQNRLRAWIAGQK